MSFFRAFGNTLGVALVLGMIGQVAFLQGDMSHAEAFLADSARLAAEIGDQRNVAHMQLLLAGLAALQGDLAVARLRYEEGLATALELDHMDLIAFGLKGLGCLAVMQGLSAWAVELWGAAEPLHESPTITNWGSIRVWQPHVLLLNTGSCSHSRYVIGYVVSTIYIYL